MGIEEFPGNSKKSQSYQGPKSSVEKPKIEKVVQSEVKVVKKGFGERFKNTFLGGEFRTAKTYIFVDVLLPALRNLVVDSITKGTERLIYGETIRRRPMDPNRPRYQYNSPTSSRYPPRSNPLSLPEHSRDAGRQTRGAEDVVLVTREEAELVVERLIDIIDNYDVASVQDLYELVGLPTSYIDNKWGWTNLSFANVKQVREGFLIDLPPAEPI